MKICVTISLSDQFNLQNKLENVKKYLAIMNKDKRKNVFKLNDLY